MDLPHDGHCHIETSTQSPSLSDQNENNSILSAAGGGCPCRLPCVESDSQGDPGEGGTPLQDHLHHEQVV